MKILVNVILLLFVAAQCHAATVLTLAHIQVPGHPRAKAAQHFADSVKTRSGGSILIEVYGRASLGDDVTMFKALQNGSLDLSATSPALLSDIVPEFNAFRMPFLFSDPAEAWRLLDGPLGQQLAQKLAAKGFIVLGFWDNGIRHFSNSVRPLLKPADFIGLKFRTPSDPVSADIIKALGGKSQQLNFSDIFNALQQRVIDGEENPLVNIYDAKFYEVQKYVSLTGHSYGITPFMMAKLTWDALSPSEHKIILAAADDATRYQRALSQKEEGEAYNELVAHGVRIDKVDTRQFIAVTAKVYDKWYASPIGDFVRAVVQAARSNK